MRLFILEIKRVLKSKMTWILLAVSLALTFLMAYLPVTFARLDYTNEVGELVTLEGLDAVRYEKELQKDIAGVVTPEKVRQAVEDYQACLREYGVEESYELPEGVYDERIYPYAPLLRGIKEALADPDTGFAPSVMEIDPEQVDRYYELCAERIVSLMKTEQKDHPAAQQDAIALYGQVEKPFLFYPGYRSDAMEYQAMLQFLVAMLCVIIAAPVFSSDYQTGADDILRCTKHGRVRLAAVKVLSALIICTISFAVCAALYLLVSNSLFGWECTKTSMQLLFSIVNLPNLDIGGLQVFILAAGLLSMMAVISFTLFLSSRFGSTVAAQAVSTLFYVLPVIVYLALPDSTVSLLLRTLLPSSGLALQASYLYMMLDFVYLNIGSMAVWMPYAMIAAAAVEIPVFIGLTVYSHARRRAS